MGDAVPEKYLYIDHTADLGFRAYGATVESLFSHAAEALFEVMVSVKTVQARQSRVIALHGAALDDLLVCWLNELLFLFDTEGLLFKEYQITDISPVFLEATAWGEPMDPARHSITSYIKAVTYHQLYVRKKEGGWEGQVFLDL